MDGREFLNELEVSSPEILLNIPIVMLTGNAATVNESRAAEIVAKPLGIEPLLALAKRYIH
jgi:CheY-like chemotaxis protein